MFMTEAEIQKSYREAKNKKGQIKILAEMNDCNQETIITILKKDPGIKDIPEIKKPGRKPKAPADDTKKKEVPVPEENPPEPEKPSILRTLYAEMEKTEAEIRKLEDKYKRLVITIETIGNYVDNWEEIDINGLQRTEQGTG